MAKLKTSLSNKVIIESKPKKTAQGCSRNTNRAATPTRGRKRRYRGQGK